MVEKPGAAVKDKRPRGPSTPRYKVCVAHRFVRRSAQDDAFVGTLMIPSRSERRGAEGSAVRLYGTTKSRALIQSKSGAEELLFEQGGLRGRFPGFAEVTQPHTDQAETLLWIQVHSLAQGEGDGHQLFTGCGRSDGCMAASEDIELTGLELEHHRARDARFLARSSPDFFCKTQDDGFGLG